MHCIFLTCKTANFIAGKQHTCRIMHVNYIHIRYGYLLATYLDKEMWNKI